MSRTLNDPTYNLATWGQTPFGSQDEMLAAMGDPRYTYYNGQDFQNAVARKLALTPAEVLGISPSTGNAGGVYSYTLPSIDQRDAAGHAAEEMSHEQNSQVLGALMGPQAIRPDSFADANVVTQIVSGPNVTEV